MGVYYIIANHTKREWLCGWCLGELQKFFEVAANPIVTGPFFCLLNGRWSRDSIDLVADTEGASDAIGREYRNVSPEAAAKWNKTIDRWSELENLRARTERCYRCRERKKGQG